MSYSGPGISLSWKKTNPLSVRNAVALKFAAVRMVDVVVYISVSLSERRGDAAGNKSASRSISGTTLLAWM